MPLLLNLLAGAAVAPLGLAYRADMELGQGLRAGAALRAGSGYNAAKDWCLKEGDAKIDCIPETVIKVKTAKYNRNKVKCGKPETPGDRSAECTANVNEERVAELCNFQTECTIPADFHAGACDANPFMGMRVSYDCIPGNPADPATTAQKYDERHGEALGNAASAAQTIITNGPLDEDGDADVTKTNAEETGDIVLDAMEESGLPPAGSFTISDLEPKVPVKPKIRVKEIKTVKGQRAIKALADAEVAKPGMSFKFKPCYRWSRWHMIKSRHFQFFQTDCDYGEGCFKMEFKTTSGGLMTFKDRKRWPPDTSMCSGSLVQSKDSYWITFFGIGLQRNDPDTWGVCLPKSGQSAIQSFFMQEDIKKKYEHAMAHLDSVKLLKCPPSVD